MTKYVFIDCSGSITDETTARLAAEATKHEGELWGFSSQVWPIRNAEDFRRGRQGTDIKAILSVVGTADTVILSDCEWGGLPANVRCVNVTN
jgi:hypothetical protein